MKSLNEFMEVLVNSNLYKKIESIANQLEDQINKKISELSLEEQLTYLSKCNELMQNSSIDLLEQYSNLMTLSKDELELVNLFRKFDQNRQVLLLKKLREKI